MRQRIVVLMLLVLVSIPLTVEAQYRRRDDIRFLQEDILHSFVLGPAVRWEQGSRYGLYRDSWGQVARDAVRTAIADRSFRYRVNTLNRFDCGRNPCDDYRDYRREYREPLRERVVVVHESASRSHMDYDQGRKDGARDAQIEDLKREVERLKQESSQPDLTAADIDCSRVVNGIQVNRPRAGNDRVFLNTPRFIPVLVKGGIYSGNNQMDLPAHHTTCPQYQDNWVAYFKDTADNGDLVWCQANIQGDRRSGLEVEIPRKTERRCGVNP